MSSPEEQVERVEVRGCPAWRAGSEGAPVVFVTGPPMSARLFRNVQARLAPRATLAVELCLPELLGPDALAGRLDEVLDEIGAQAVVAHGLAVPVAARCRGRRALVLTNGTLGEPDPVLRAMARLGPSVLARLLFRPEVLGRWMPSSLGLRRRVTNPYVMDRDIVVMLLEPVVRDAGTRAAAAQWVCGVVRSGFPASVDSSRISAVWGDNDPLCPLEEVRRLVSPERLLTVPGGRHLHPEERPWELADRLETLLWGPTTT